SAPPLRLVKSETLHAAARARELPVLPATALSVNFEGRTGAFAVLPYTSLSASLLAATGGSSDAFVRLCATCSVSAVGDCATGGGPACSGSSAATCTTDPVFPAAPAGCDSRPTLMATVRASGSAAPRPRRTS